MFFAVLGGQPVQFVTGCLVHDDLARSGVPVPHDLVTWNGFATLGDFETGVRPGHRLPVQCLPGEVSSASSSSFWGMNRVQNLSILLLELTLRALSRLSSRDDPGSDLAVQLLLVVALVDGDDLAQDTPAELDIQRLHLLVEHLHPVFDVVLTLAFEEVLDCLFGLGRGDYFEPFGFGPGVVGGDDLDLIAAVDLRGNGFESCG